MAGFALAELLIGLFCLAVICAWIWTTVDIAKSEFNGNNKILWLILTIFVPLIGMSLYWFIGQDRKVNPELA